MTKEIFRVFEKNMVEILPAVLATTPEQYEQDIKNLAATESFQDGWIHIDFMDNKFVPNQSIKPDVVKKYPTNLKKEAHLMVEEPKDWIEDLVEAKLDRVIIHMESNEVMEAVVLAKTHGLEVGIALKNKTPVESLEPFVDKIDMVLIMSVEPGFQGQPFLEESIERVEEALRLRSAKNGKFRIAVDGAVKDINAKKLVEAGVDQLDIGSFLLKGDIDANVEKIWEVLQG